MSFLKKAATTPGKVSAKTSKLSAKGIAKLVRDRIERPKREREARRRRNAGVAILAAGAATGAGAYIASSRRRERTPEPTRAAPPASANQVPVPAGTTP